MRRWVALVSVTLVGLVPSAFSGTGHAVQMGPSTTLSGGITFDHASIVDPFRLVGEPDIAIDSKGGIYTSGPGGTPTQHSWFWKSDDGGNQWHGVGVVPEYKGNGQNGGGDTEIAIDKNDNVYTADLQSTLCDSVQVSTDRGKTFATSEGCVPSADREWMTTYTAPNGSTRVYLQSNPGLASTFTDGCWVLVSTDGGHTYLSPNGPGTWGEIDGDGCIGKMVADPRNGNLYVPMSGGDIAESTDGAKTWTVVGNDPDVVDNLFASLAIDSAGNLYQSWTDIKHTYLSVSTDGGQDWSRFQVNTADLKQMIMPWAVAGDAGRVAVVYYATTDTGKTGGSPGSSNAVWNAYAAISTDAASATPHFQQVQVSEHPMKLGTICIDGLNCLTERGDRSLADFFQVGMDPNDGRIFIVYDDDADTSSEQPDLSKATGNLGKPIVVVARQRTGPSLLDKPDLLPLGTTDVAIAGTTAGADGTVTVSGTQGLPAGNWAADPAGDAKWPVVPVTGPNNPALDIREASAGDDGAGNLTFKLTAADLSNAALAQSIQSVGKPAWVFFWNYDNKHWFVRWNGTGPAEFGQVGALNWPALGSPAPKVLTYVPSGQATASLNANTLSITVPAASVGNPPVGKKLDSLTAYTWSEKGPVPSVVDQAEAFSYLIGTPAASQHAPDGYVQVSVDDPSFATPVTAALGSGNGYTAQVGPLAAGTHTIYVRQVLSAALYNPGLWDDVVAGPVVSTTVTV